MRGGGGTGENDIGIKEFTGVSADASEWYRGEGARQLTVLSQHDWRLA